jgi:cell division protein FtsI/penicillin-binding protein 2
MLKKYFVFLTLIFALYSCAIVSEKATQKADKENAYLKNFLNKPSAILNQTFGKPTQTLAENNQTVHVYEIKGKVFDCQRKFTIDNKNIVTGFVSTCWD